jgi:hypothetical protein
MLKLRDFLDIEAIVDDNEDEETDEGEIGEYPSYLITHSSTFQDR